MRLLGLQTGDNAQTQSARDVDQYRERCKEEDDESGDSGDRHRLEQVRRQKAIERKALQKLESGHETCPRQEEGPVSVSGTLRKTRTSAGE